jgi:5-bromo-4-chloroindolyl phosphate hydrolysis protein
MKKLVCFFLVVILIGCGTRKVEKTENLEKIKSDSFTANSKFLRLQKINLETFTDKGYKYIKEPTAYGIKETFIQNNKVFQKLKIVDSVRFICNYKTITKKLYKSVKTKKTQSDGVSTWVWFTGLFFAFLFAIICNWKRIITRYRRN